jgi:hypothetical protein
MRSISLAAAAVACALALSTGAPISAPLDSANPASTWLKFRAALAAEDLWPDVTNHGSHSVKSKARAATVLDNRTLLDKAKLNAGAHAVQLASAQPLPPGKSMR